MDNIVMQTTKLVKPKTCTGLVALASLWAFFPAALRFGRMGYRTALENRTGLRSTPGGSVTG